MLRAPAGAPARNRLGAPSDLLRLLFPESLFVKVGRHIVPGPESPAELEMTRFVYIVLAHTPIGRDSPLRGCMDRELLPSFCKVPEQHLLEYYIEISDVLLPLRDLASLLWIVNLDA